MTRIEQYSAQIDRDVACVRQALDRGSLYDSGVRLTTLAEAIEQHRAEVNKELDGLRGDVKSAEAAYEREKVRADALDQEKDRWTNVHLPGWRKRVSEAERQRDQWKNDHDRIAKEKHQLSQAYDSNVAELKSLARLTDEVQKERDGLLVAIESLKRDHDDCHALPIFATDTGSAEGDKTVISWVCTCGKRKSFEPPKNAYWSTNHKCACGAHLHLSPVGDD